MSICQDLKCPINHVLWMHADEIPEEQKCILGDECPEFSKLIVDEGWVNYNTAVHADQEHYPINVDAENRRVVEAYRPEYLSSLTPLPEENPASVERIERPLVAQEFIPPAHLPSTEREFVPSDTLSEGEKSPTQPSRQDSVKDLSEKLGKKSGVYHTGSTPPGSPSMATVPAAPVKQLNIVPPTQAALTQQPKGKVHSDYNSSIGVLSKCKELGKANIKPKAIIAHLDTLISNIPALDLALQNMISRVLTGCQFVQSFGTSIMICNAPIHNGKFCKQHHTELAARRPV